MTVVPCAIARVVSGSRGGENERRERHIRKLPVRAVRGAPGNWSTLVAVMVSVMLCATGPANARPVAGAAAAGGSTYAITLNYVVRFYPRFLTYFQQSV